MEYAILLHFDQESEAKILGLWKEAQACGGDSHLINSGLRPHISLALFEDNDISLCCSKLEAFVKATKKFDLRLGSIGTFAGGQGVLYLSPVMTAELYKLHNGLYDLLNGELKNLNNYYLPNNWVPHCSISINNSIETTAAIFQKMIEIYEPLEIQIGEISIVECEPDICYIRRSWELQE